MFAGDLRTRILIQKAGPTGKDESGTPIETFEDFKYVNAKKVFKDGNTEFADDGALPYTKTEFIIRYDSTINHKCRIYYNNRKYKIYHIDDQNNKQWMRILATVYDYNE